jgi:hypothetical protein
MVTTSASLPALAITPIGIVPEAAIGGSGIASFAVSPTGLIAVDNGASEVVVITSSGARLRTIGRSGAGPGEFRGSLLLGWLRDTLVVVDNQLRRTSLFRAETGKLLATSSNDRNARPWYLSAASAKLYAISPVRMAEKRARPNTPDILFPVLMSAVAPITSSGIGGSIPTLTDSLNEADGFDCEERDGSVSITGFFKDHGPLVTILPGPRLVTASRDSFLLTIRSPTPATPSQVIRDPTPRHPIPKETWDSLTAPYRSANGTLRCGKESQRPDFLPAIRAIQSDEVGRIWVETTNPRGTEIRVLSSTGIGLGRFSMPPHDESVAWQVRSGVLYLVVVDSDGLQSVRSFRVQFP